MTDGIPGELSAAASNAAIGQLTKASEGLRALDASRLKPLELASIFRAAAAVASFATESEAVALGLDTVLKEALHKESAVT